MIRVGIYFSFIFHFLCNLGKNLQPLQLSVIIEDSWRQVRQQVLIKKSIKNKQKNNLLLSLYSLMLLDNYILGTTSNRIV